MKFYRVWALLERDMRKFFRSPTLMITSMVFPLMQLIVLGYAFGGKIKGVDVALCGSGPFRPFAHVTGAIRGNRDRAADLSRRGISFASRCDHRSANRAGARSGADSL